MAYAREASHAGSWYTDDGKKLARQLDRWLDEARTSADGGGGGGGALRAVIAPHAGYSYSGAAAAHAYCALDASRVRRVFLLGPSHHKFSRRCLLSAAAELRTPVGTLRVDEEAVAALRATGEFGSLSRQEDEDEHSLEMHLPFLARLLRERADVRVVPVVVGALDTAAEERYGRLLAPHLNDPGNFFVVSSDFCHWGERFRFTYHDKSKGAIWQSSEALDREGMRAIEAQDPAGYAAYQKKYANTICGRHPIAVLLHAMKAARGGFSTRFVHYSQSSRAETARDSSVSYASALVRGA
jgi:AmmeMemoRadiSam system protein B